MPDDRLAEISQYGMLNIKISVTSATGSGTARLTPGGASNIQYDNMFTLSTTTQNVTEHYIMYKTNSTKYLSGADNSNYGANYTLVNSGIDTGKNYIGLYRFQDGGSVTNHSYLIELYAKNKLIFY